MFKRLLLMSELKIQGLDFNYGSRSVVNHISFHLKKGETGVIIGRSGSGKSTLLKLIAGLLKPAAGDILIDNLQVLPPDQRLVPGEPGVKLVSQTFDLMPFISAKENVFQGMMRLLDEEKEAIATQLLHTLGLQELANEKAKNLSGGQQQRVAIARALAEKPKLLLMDEVFAQLDKATKWQVMLNLKNYIQAEKTTALFVLHDAEDAFFLADTVLVMQSGVIVQQGSPLDVYQKPVNEEISSLFGHGNFLPIEIAQDILPINSENLHTIGGHVFFRPNQFRLKDFRSDYTIESRIAMPTHIIYVIKIDGHTLWVEER
jgi:ABC-type sugar transport system ATPase subunit